jgi:hypothetical protein
MFIEFLFFGGATADFSAFARGTFVDGLASARTAFFAAAGYFIDGRPSASLGFAALEAARFITFFDVFGLAFLFARITGFITLWHNGFSVQKTISQIHAIPQPLRFHRMFEFRLKTAMRFSRRFCNLHKRCWQASTDWLV